MRGYLIQWACLLGWLPTVLSYAQNPAGDSAATARRQQEAASKHLGQPVELTNSIGMKLALIPAGEFQMGSPADESGRDSDETQHLVRLTRPFYLGTTEVTQEQYERVMGVNPSSFTGDPQRPVEGVSWEDAVEFCRKLSETEGRTYRLPTDAEWEYARRAGSKTQWSFGDAKSALNEYAWYRDNSKSRTHPVGEKKPNAWGLYDMYGNVYEWCSDWYGEYATTRVDDPTGPMAGSYRVIRGGSWYSRARYCRSANRGINSPGNRSFILGFRVASSSVDASSK